MSGLKRGRKRKHVSERKLHVGKLDRCRSEVCDADADALSLAVLAFAICAMNVRESVTSCASSLDFLISHQPLCYHRTNQWLVARRSSLIGGNGWRE